MAMNYKNKADILRKQEKFLLALTNYELSLKQFAEMEQQNKDKTRAIRIVYNNIGKNYYSEALSVTSNHIRRKELLQKSHYYLTASLEQRKTLGYLHPDLIENYINLAKTDIELNNYQSAFEYLTEVKNEIEFISKDFLIDEYQEIEELLKIVNENK